MSAYTAYKSVAYQIIFFESEGWGEFRKNIKYMGLDHTASCI